MSEFGHMVYLQKMLPTPALIKLNHLYSWNRNPIQIFARLFAFHFSLILSEKAWIDLLSRFGNG